MSAAAGWIEHEFEDGADVLYLKGAWLLSNLTAIVADLRSLRLRAGERFVLDGSRLEALDTAAGFTLYSHLSGLGCTEAMVAERRFEERHARLLKLVHERMKCPPAAQRSGGSPARPGSHVAQWTDTSLRSAHVQPRRPDAAGVDSSERVAPTGAVVNHSGSSPCAA